MNKNTMPNPVELEKVYLSDGKNPARNGWRSGDDSCLCPMTMNMMNKGHVEDYDELSSIDIEKRAYEVFGKYYVLGFMNGFDRGYKNAEQAIRVLGNPTVNVIDTWIEGCRDGIEIRDHLLSAEFELYDVEFEEG